ncbi:MAG: YIP1 family protein [Phycisphaerae bacterium]|nr:YIP1 family protein [Phycisphaerae bacterium]
MSTGVAARPAEAAPRKRVGLVDIPGALLHPRSFFRRVEDVPAYAWPLTLLLAAHLVLGWMTIETGLIDRGVQRSVQNAIAEIESRQVDVVERSTLRKMIEDQRDLGQFKQLLSRLKILVLSPLAVLAEILCLAAAFYGLVALTGRKPEWSTLLTVFVFAGFADLTGRVIASCLVLRFGTLDVDTSLALLTELPHGPFAAMPASSAAMLSGLLSAADPFRMWFWWIAATGLSTTHQLRGWRAGVACGFCWLAAAAFRGFLATAALSNAA